jgi:ubiquinone/menaquinone biosynthesis C-methylase UbiE
MRRLRLNTGWLYALLWFVVAAHPARAQESRTAPSPGADPSINRPFQQPDYAVWTERLEGESREIYAKRDEIVDASGVKSGMHVADVGAGTGFMTMLFARKVGPAGRVTAVDISPAFVEAIGKRASQEGLANVSTVLGTQTDTRLPQGSVDLVYTSDTYHHFENVTPVLASIRQALKTGGRFIVIDFQRIPGTTSERTLTHVRAGKETVIQEVEGAGFRLLQDVTRPALKQNYYLIFERI